jgi:hypothetical protein
MARRAFLLTALLVLRATASQAHAVGVSRGEYRIEDAQVRADLVFARPELLATLPGLDADRDGQLTSGEIENARGELADWIHRGIAVRVSAGPCAGHLDAASLTEQDGVELAAVYQCPPHATAFSVHLGLLTELSLGHRHLATVISPAETAHAVLYDAQPELTLATPTTTAGALGSTGPSMFRLGIEHILTGYDHWLFLLALVLIGGPLRSVLGMITDFTLAHSVTLAVAAFGIWVPRPTLVELAIALSIACVGIENCVAFDLHRRWRLIFLFGLVHGFGFAGALREVAVSAVRLPLALASFNLGVEAGQLAVLSVVLPFVWWLGRRTWFANGGLQASSIAVSAVGLWWFVARVISG